MAYINVEITTDELLNLLFEDQNFAAEFWFELAMMISAGGIMDDAADICSGLDKEKVKFMAGNFHAFADAMKNGYNMSHLDEI